MTEYIYIALSDLVLDLPTPPLSPLLLIHLVMVSRLRWNKERFSPKVGTGFGRSNCPRFDADSLFVKFSEQ